MRGQHSTTLLRPLELRSILNDISHRLPNSLKLNEFERQKIMWYNKMLPATVISDNNKINIISVIPFSDSDPDSDYIFRRTLLGHYAEGMHVNF